MLNTTIAAKKRTLDGDKSVLDIRKAEERVLSERIYKSMQLLNVMFPRSFELEKCFSQDMFLKPNTKAFPFVMHYLFNILDPVEFKKRFYWPLDRSSENAFRTTTVQYLNYLNEKHNLGWGEVKAFLVVMPGGMKFMKLLHDLIDFIADEEIKKTMKLLPENFDKDTLAITKENIESIVSSHDKFMAKAVIAKEKIQEQKHVFKDNAEILSKKINEVCEEIGLPPSKLDDGLLENFSRHNSNLYETSIKTKVDELEDTEKYLDKLSDEIDAFTNEKPSFSYDKDALLSSYRRIQTENPGACPDPILTAQNKIQLESLFNAFNCIFPTLDDALQQCAATKTRTEKYEYEIGKVSELQTEAVQVEMDILKFESEIDAMKIDFENIRKRTANDTISTPDRSNIVAEQNLKLKYIHTPAIYVHSDDPIGGKARLPLLDESFANQTTVLAQRTVQAKNNNSFVAGNTSKLIDPLTLLRTVTKSASRKNWQKRFNTSNLSALQSRFRDDFAITEREALSQTALGTEEMPLTPVSGRTRKIFSKEESDRHNAIKEKFIGIRHIQLTPDSIMRQNRKRSVSLQGVDLNVIAKSPSGRLEPLVKMSPTVVRPQIQINDVPVMSFQMTESTANKGVNLKNIETTPAGPSSHKMNTDDNKENAKDDLDTYCLEFQRKLNLNGADESLCNVSDSILKDISF